MPLLQGDDVTHDEFANDVTREDIEREKKNLNLDNFIRKLSMPGDVLEVNLISR